MDPNMSNDPLKELGSREQCHNKINDFQKALYLSLESICNSMTLNNDTYVEDQNCLSVNASVETFVKFKKKISFFPYMYFFRLTLLKK